MRRESSGRRAVVAPRRRRPKPAPRRVAVPVRVNTSSLGSNAARAHGYSAPKPRVVRAVRKREVRRAAVAPQRVPLRVAARADVADEGRRGSAAERGAGFRRQYAETARRVRIRRNEQRLKARFDPRTGNYVRKVRRAILPDLNVVIDPRTGKATRDLKKATRQGETQWASAGSTSTALEILDQTLRPVRASAGATRAAIRGENPLEAVGRGLAKNKGPLFGDVLREDLGVKKGPAAAGGFVLDVLADPTTYLTFGAKSVAQREAARVARQVQKRALRQGMSRELAERVGARAGRRAAEGARQGSGVTVRFAGREAPGVTRATERVGAVVKRATPEGVKRKGRTALRQVNPAIAPEGVDAATHLQLRQAGGRSRAAQANLTQEALDNANVLLRRVPERQQEAFVNAVERNRIRELPDDLAPLAREFRDQMRYASRLRRRAGVTEGVIGGERRMRPRPSMTADVQGARKALGQERRRVARLRAQREELRRAAGVAQGRSEILSRNVGGRASEIAAVRAGNVRALTPGRRAGGQVGVTQTERALRITERRLGAAENRLRLRLGEGEAQRRLARTERRRARRWERTAERRKGEARGYFPHMLSEAIEPESAAQQAKRVATRGRVRTLNPSTSRGRSEKRPIGELNPERVARGESPFSTNVPLVRANYGSQTAGAAARGELVESLKRVGKPLRAGTRTIDEGEAVYKFVPGGLPKKLDLGTKEGKAELRQAQKAMELQAPGKVMLRRTKDGRVIPQGPLQGQYRILNERAVDDALRRIEANRTEIGAAFDRAQGGWKLVATGTPGFQVRNLIGDNAMAFLAQGRKVAPIASGGLGTVVHGARAATRISRVERARQQGKHLGPAKRRYFGKGTPKTIKVAGRKVPMDDFVREAMREGIGRGGQRGHEIQSFQRGGGAAEVARGLSGGGKVRQAGRKYVKQPVTGSRAWKATGRALKNREDMTRLATYKWARDRGLSPADAATASKRVHFDYGEVTDAERVFLRRAAPFYTFSSRALPFHVRALLQHPGRYAGIEKARQELAGAFGLGPGWEGDLPEYKQRAIPFAGPGNRALDAALPINLLNEVPNPKHTVGEQLDEWGQFLAGQATPFAKLPVELLANRSFFFRRDIQSDDRPRVAAPDWVKRLPKGSVSIPGLGKINVRAALGVAPITDTRSGKTVTGWYGKSDYIAKSLPGMPVILQQLTTEGSLRSGRTGVDKWVSASGVKSDPIDPVSVRLFKLLERSHELDVKINGLTQDKRNLGGKKSPNPEVRRLYAQQQRVDEEVYRLSVKRKDARPYRASQLSNKAKARAVGGGSGSGGAIPQDELGEALGRGGLSGGIPQDELKRALGR